MSQLYVTISPLVEMLLGVTDYVRSALLVMLLQFQLLNQFVLQWLRFDMVQQQQLRRPTLSIAALLYTSGSAASKPINFPVL